MSVSEYNDFYEYNSSEWKISREKKYESTHLQGFIQKHVIPCINADACILNVGEGKSSSYGLSESSMVYHDTASTQAGDLTHLSCKMDKLYDVIVCSASALNHIDSMTTIETFSKVLCKGGLLILNFMNSHSSKLLISRGFNKKAIFTDTPRTSKRQWYYSEGWISELLQEYGFEIIQKHNLHDALSPFWKSIKKNNKSGVFNLDAIVCRIPFIRNLGSDTIIFCRKKAC